MCVLLIGLIRNLQSQHISSQFYVVCDEFFTKVHYDSNTIALVDRRTHLFRFSSEYFNDSINGVPVIGEEWLTHE